MTKLGLKIRLFASIVAASAMLSVLSGTAALAQAPVCSVWLIESSRFMNVPFGAFMPDSVLNRLDIHRTPTSVRPIYIHSEVIVRGPGFTFDYPGKPRLCEKPFQFTKVKPVSMLVRLAQLIC